MVKGGKAPKRKSRVGLWITLGVILVIILAIIIFLIVMSTPYTHEFDRGIPEVGIDILDMPLRVDPGEEFTVTWRIMGFSPTETKLLHSPDVATDGTITYEEVPVETETENAYVARMTAPDEELLTLRIYATDGTTEYATDEQVVVIG